ncbi:MAG: hypothetical protein K2I82_01895, partial [Ruminococcus sp.]|nr:hypothetical protein [Ruminococcus sp.]
MNILKKSAVILLLIFLTGCEDSLTQLGFSPTATEQPTVNEKEVSEDEIYNGIVQSLENMTMISEHNKKLDGDTVSGIIERIKLEYPEFFWIDGCT